MATPAPKLKRTIVPIDGKPCLSVLVAFVIPFAIISSTLDFADYRSKTECMQWRRMSRCIIGLVPIVAKWRSDIALDP